ncbi:ABC transporter substrate-binding protein [Arenibaculum pallidiluteum]|uniref:ABC transporter substrate-binding protein n=1 Tax=Arenibaculum pallidiluteum TaxID=2812559 RepID=UPI001A96E76C|nr:ABC transporter substrate-binding protein [Arenibaculum pallidiluteum]
MTRLLIAALITLALWLVPGDGRAQRAAAPKGTHENPFKIEMIVFRGCEDGCRGFRDFLASRKVPVEIRLHDAATDANRIPGFVAEIKQRRPDLVVTWGTTTAMRTFGPFDAADTSPFITDIPGVFMIVAAPLELKLVPDLASSRRNITGTLYLVPEAVQIEAAQSYFGFSRVGVIYTATEQNSVVNVQQLRETGKRMGFQVVERTVATDKDGKPDPASIPRLVKELAAERVDLIYQGADTFLNINRVALTEEAVRSGIPVFAAGEAPVRTAKALMGVVNQYYVVGQLTALKAEQVLRGARPESIPIEAPKRFSFLVNLPVAKELKLYPPMKLIRFAEFIQ